MTPAVDALKHAKIAFELHEYEHDPRAHSYALEAAQALNIDPGSVYKTLLAQLDSKELIVAIVPADHSLNLKSLAKAAKGKRAQMADPNAAQRSTGYVLGGISPLGQKKRLRTFVDDSMLALDIVHVSGGRRGLEIALAPNDLVSATQAHCAPIAAG